MEENPYIELIRIMQNTANGQIPVAYRFGKVISEVPLKVETSGTIQESFNLLKNASLYENGKRIKLKRYIDGEIVEYYPPDNFTLKKGDLVLLLPIENEQKFIILCKVVSA